MKNIVEFMSASDREARLNEIALSVATEFPNLPVNERAEIIHDRATADPQLRQALKLAGAKQLVKEILQVKDH